MKEFICIVCPKGCHLKVDDEGNVTGHTCIRGEKYGKQEAVDPKRTLTSTVKINSKLVRRLPVITSDDVFDRVLDIRRVNNGIDNKREDLLREWLESNSDDADTTLHGLDDYERWKRISDARNKNKTQSQFIRSRLIRNVQERSNGESSLALFVDSIADDALYLLDEPENSLSPANQLELKYFIEDCIRNHGCQFIISTHSPFLLSLKGAKIYDIDSNPVETRKWTELDCVRVYKKFFEENEHKF